MDWSKLDYRNPEQRKQIAGALQYFCSLPNKFAPPRFAKVAEFVKAQKEIRSAQMQAFTIPSDFPTKPVEIIEKYHLLDDYDNAYEQIFDVRDFSGQKTTGFDIMRVSSGLTFGQVKIGEKLKVYQASGEKIRCSFNTYGGALGWHRQLFDDGDYWTIEDNAIEFRNKAYSSRAAIYYALIEAAADAKGCCDAVPADCTGCHADALSIMNSVNYAARQILVNCKDKGYGLNPQTTQFIVLAPIQLRGRVRMALGVRNQAFGDAEPIRDFNFTQITSLMLTNPNQIMVILPKKGFKAGYRMDLTLFDDFDILSYTDTVAGWMRYGGAISDLDQIECIEFTAESGSCPATPDGMVGDVETVED